MAVPDLITVEISSQSGEFKSITDRPILFLTRTIAYEKETDPEDMPHILMLACTSPIDKEQVFCFGAMAHFAIRDSDGFHSLVNSLFERMQSSSLTITEAVACIPRGAESSPTLAGYLQLFTEKLGVDEMKKVRVVKFNPKKAWLVQCKITPQKDSLAFLYELLPQK
jgi:hypothetical protein